MNTVTQIPVANGGSTRYEFLDWLRVIAIFVLLFVIAGAGKKLSLGYHVATGEKQQMRRKGLLIGGLAIVAVIGVAVWAGRDTYEFARIGSVYAAKQTCSCLFIARRPIESCKTDYDAEAVKPFTWTVADNSVTISAAGGLVSARAVFEEGFGCHPAD